MAVLLLMGMRVEIWTDINCPFCYLGKTRFEEALGEFVHRDEVQVVHRSFELDPTTPAGASGSVISKIAEKYGISTAEAAANEQQIGAQAAAMGLPYLTEGRDYGNSFDMHRLLHHALANGKQDAMLDALYRGNFAEPQSLFADHQRLVDLAVEAGLDEAGARAVLADSTAYAREVRADETEAARLGATGVPFFVFDRKYGISGAQPTAVFAQALDQAWVAREPAIDTVGGGQVCGPDGCEIPSRD